MTDIDDNLTDINGKRADINGRMVGRCPGGL